MIRPPIIVPRETRRAIIAAVTSGLAPLKAEPPVPLSTWAAEHFELDEESSHKRGRWEPWPFQIGVMDAMSHDGIEEVNVKKAKRTGYTKMIVANAAYNAGHRRRKQAIWQPTDDDRDSFEKSEIGPAFDLCKPVKAVRRATSQDTIKFKRFRGSVLHLLGANSARNFRRITLAVSTLDEVDAMPQIVDKTIDPISGAKGRLEGAPFPKLIIGTTPLTKGISHIERRVNTADARMLYHVPCPLCEVEHPVTWGDGLNYGFKWDGTDPTTAHHVCPHCLKPYTQAQYLSVWHLGAWVDHRHRWRYDHTAKVWLDAEGHPCEPPKHVAFDFMWTAYSPQRSWSDIAKEFLDAQAAKKLGNDGPMMTFKNETLASVYEDEFVQTDAAVLQKRAQEAPDIPLRIVPPGACKLLAFIDTQRDRWELTTWAWGRGGELWPVDHRVIYGNPADQAEWAAKLDPFMATQYTHAWGQRMPLDAVGIDTQGSNWTHQAYNYVRERPHLPLYATRGDGALGKPIKMKPIVVDVNARGRTIKRGLKVWRICVNTAKDLIHSRLENVKAPGPGHIHLNRHLPPEWYAQLCAEHRIKVRTARGIEERWVCPSGHRNEALDCLVGVLFLGEVLGLGSETAATWDRWESALKPDLFSAPPAAAEATTTTAAPEPIAPMPAPMPPAPPPRRTVPVTTAPVPGLGSSEWSSRL